MTTQAPSHPLDRLSRADRRRWRRLDRRARAEQDDHQLGQLRDLGRARATVDSVSRVDTASSWVTVVGLHVGGRRLMGRVPAGAGAALEAAVASGPVGLTGAGRYGPYWTLTFAGRGAPVALLINGLVVARGDGGLGGDVWWPVLQLVG